MKNSLESIPSNLSLSMIVILFLCNWFWGTTNGDDCYGIQLVIPMLGVATTMFLAVSVRWNATAENDRQSSQPSVPDKEDRFFTISPNLLCVVDLNGYFQYLNPAAEKILGYSPASMLGQPFIEFVHPDDRKSTLKEAETVTAGNQIISFENRCQCADGSYKWLVWNVCSFEDEKLIYGIGRDITDRKIVEAALLESNILFESVLKSTTDTIFFKDIQSRYLLINSTAAAIMGKPKLEIIGKTDAEFFPPEIADISDISDRKQAEIALQQSEEKYRCLIEATSQIIWNTKADGAVVNEQLGWSAFTGKTYDEIKGWGWLNDIHPDDGENTTRLWSEAITNRTIYKIEHRLRRYDGEYRYMSVRAVPILNADGSIREWVGVHADITPRKRAEAELRQQKEFLSSIYDSVNYSIFVLDVGADGEFRYSGWNRAAELFSGISSKFGCGKTPEEILPEFTVVFFLPKLRECLLRNTSVSYEQAVNFGTTEAWSLTTLNPLRDESGKICRIVGTAVDITDRKKAEQALAEQLKLSIFTAEVGIALTQNQTLAATLQSCTDAIVRHLDAAFARIWTLNEEIDVLELQASSGIYTHINGAHSRIVVGEFKIGLIAKNRQPHLTNAVTEDPRVSDREWAKREGMVAFAGYPLIVDNQLLGVIAMFARHELNESTLMALASVADAIGLGIKRKQTEVALARQQQTLRSIIDNAPIWVWMIDRNGRMLLVNKTFCEDVAIPESTFLAASGYAEVLGVEVSANCIASDVQAWSQDTPYYAEEILQLADGEYHQLETIKSQVKDAYGNAIGLIGLGLDVTAQKEYQRQLQDSEVRFRKLAEQEALVNQLASNIRASLDLDTILATTVHQIRDLLLLDRCLFIWYQPEASPPVWNVTYEAKNADLPSMLGLYPTDLTGCHSEQIANLEIIQIDDFNNVTNRVERDFFISTGFHSLLDIPLQTQSGQIGVIACASCGTMRQWSDEEVELLMAIGTQLAIAINQAELYTQSLDSARIAREQATKIEMTLCELQQAQTQLIQAEKMSSLGQMVAGIAHEINNPVSFIFGNLTYTEEYIGSLMKLLQMYRDEFPEVPLAIQSEIDALDLNFLLNDLPKMLSSMKVGATRIRDIVRSLRNFSRLDESEMKKVNIHEGIDSTLMILEHRLKAQSVSIATTEYHRPIIQVVKEYGELPLVECYAGLLNQVFMNMIANAIDALADNMENPGIIGIHTEIEGDFVAIAISDNGIGMTDAVKQRIFDPFYTTKPIGSGTGMGLAISHSIVVEKHLGEINCISDVGQGTEFIIKIPIVSY